MGPGFSVISMRPSGRKAIRQGRLNVVTVVMLKGRLGSGFCLPILTWAQTAAEGNMRSNAALANFIVFVSEFIFVSFSSVYKSIRYRNVTRAAVGRMRAVMRSNRAVDHSTDTLVLRASDSHVESR